MTDTPMNTPGASPFPPAPGMPGEQKPSVPPPPPEITIRTMQGDVKSMNETGGGAPIAKPFAAPVVPPEEKLTIPGYQGPEEAVFTPENIPAQGAKPSIEPEAKKGSTTKLLLVILISLAVAGGLGFGAYYFLYPIVFPAQVVVQTPPPTPPATPPTPTPAPAPATTTTAVTHASYFGTAADKVEKITLTPDALNATSLHTNLVTSAGDKLAAGTLKEIYFADANDSVISFEKLIIAAIPELAPLESQIQPLFATDFTGFIYYDGTNAWPGYIAKLADGANAILAKTVASEIEKYPSSLVNLFAQDPGSAGAVWKDGSVSGNTGRYLAFTKAGASLNYLWANNYLVIATNYKAAQEAVKRLPSAKTQ